MIQVGSEPGLIRRLSVLQVNRRRKRRVNPRSGLAVPEAQPIVLRHLLYHTDTIVRVPYGTFVLNSVQPYESRMAA